MASDMVKIRVSQTLRSTIRPVTPAAPEIDVNPLRRGKLAN